LLGETGSLDGEEIVVSTSTFKRALLACAPFLILIPSIAIASTCVGHEIRTPHLNEANSLNAVFALAPNEAWVSGSDASGGLLFYRWDGSRWKRPSLPLSVTSVSDITALSPSDVWLAGQGDANNCCAMAVHYDGNFWDPQAPNYYSNGYNGFNSVADFGPNEVWAVGDDWEYGCSGCPPVDFDFMEHWDGTHWTHIPFFYGNYVGLVAIRGVSANDMWVLERPTYDQAGSYVLAFHRIGYRWVVRQIKGPERFTSLTALGIVSPNDVWAVGGQSSSERDPGRPLIAHWNGHVWSVMQGPVGVNGESLSSVAAISTNDVWAVGGGLNGALVEHWDGIAWSRVPSRFASGFSGAAAIPGTNEVWAVGSASNHPLGNVSAAAIFHC
jgi:hypothetical protein